MTGASSGIGADVAKHLDHQGYRVIALGRSQEKLQAVASDFTQPYLLLVTDIAKALDVQEAFTKLQEWTNTLDLLINNAGRIQRECFLDSTEESWSMQFQTNLFGAFRITQKAFHLLKRSKTASVINISSSLAKNPVNSTAIYSASKAAMNNWTRSLAIEWAEHHICVNAINPGLIYTPIHSFYEKTDAISQAQIKRGHAISPLGRMGETQDIVEAVDYLMQARWVTGSVLTVDGGSHL